MPTCSPPATAWSCDHPTDPFMQHYCTETYDSDPSVLADIQMNCEGDGGTFSAAPCSKTSAVGFCSAISQGELGSIYFYDAMQITQDQMSCGQLSGMWCSL
jgi:hypothetical protein